MARVVQRRPNPPYLLIIFVFLFLVSTTLAVLFYTRQDDAREKLAKKQQELKKLAEDTDFRKGYVKGHMAQKAKPSATGDIVGVPEPDQEADWAEKRTVVTRLDTHLSTLSKEINPTLIGSEGDVISRFIEAMKELDKAQKVIKKWKSVDVMDSDMLPKAETETAGPSDAVSSTEWAGVLKEFKTAYEDKFDQQIKVCRILKKNLDNLNKDSEAMKKRIASLDAKVKTKSTECNTKAEAIDKADSKIASLTGKLSSATKIGSDRKTKLDTATKTITSNEATINKQIKEIDKLKHTIARMKMEKRVKDIRVKRTILMTRPDGRIDKIVANQNLCYINIGLKQQVDVGHTFSVYPKTGIPVPPKSKARITVIRVEDSSSACRITSQSDEDPIDVGDIIANLVFDSRRKYTFVVEGQFDLYNTGRPTPIDKQEVILLIRRFGGKVAGKMDIDVDYVVMGVSSKPESPEDPTPEDQEQYKRLKEAHDRYNAAKQAAIKMGIPILNTNRFLDLVGYTPTKTLKR